MARHFEPATWAAPRPYFDAAQLRTWQKESIRHMSAQALEAWLAPAIAAGPGRCTACRLH